jgi:hypothetical protein
VGFVGRGGRGGGGPPTLGSTFLPSQISIGMGNLRIISRRQENRAERCTFCLGNESERRKNFQLIGFIPLRAVPLIDLYLNGHATWGTLGITRGGWKGFGFIISLQPYYGGSNCPRTS